MDLKKVDEVLNKYDENDRLKRRSALISILQDIQRDYNYLPKEALCRVSERLGIPLMEIYTIATFYTAFSLKPRGKHVVSVCLGTACHVRGGLEVLAAMERELDVKMGETTSDNKFTLKTVRCVGCCALAPVVMIGNNFHGKLIQPMIPKILKKYE
jgi:NADH-quinone oxidoreductase subunit E